MNTNDLQPWQIEKMMQPIQRSLRYLSALLSRMDDVGFTSQDELHRSVIAAQAHMQSLYMTLHYLSCGHGVGKPPRANGANETNGGDFSPPSALRGD